MTKEPNSKNQEKNAAKVRPLDIWTLLQQPFVIGFKVEK